MSDPTTDVIVATGGTAVVRAAYRSGNPAWGVGPGNVPALVDHTADLAAAAQRLMDSKSFDNSILCTNESCVIVEERVGRRLPEGAGAARRPRAVGRGRRGRARGALPRRPDAGRPGRQGRRRRWRRRPASACRRARACWWRRSRWSSPRSRWRARSSSRCSGSCACRTPGAESTPPARCCGSGAPATRRRSTRTTRGRSWPTAPPCRCCAWPSTSARSTGSAGIGTNLAPTMTVGTGFFGRSSLGENLEPRHLINLTRVAYASDPAEPFGDFDGLQPWNAALDAEPVPGARAAAPTSSSPARRSAGSCSKSCESWCTIAH